MSRPAWTDSTRTLSLVLQALDPATGWYSDDPLVGLLYPEDGTNRGVGSISYLVKPMAGLPSGTVIQNQAKIVFDYNDPINTPLVKNTLDAGTPTSQVDPLPATTTDTTFPVSWSGQDEANGSGIASYDLYVSVDGGSFFPLLTATTDTSTNFTGLPGHTYAFYTLARDNVGHVESRAGHARRHHDDPGHDHGECRRSRSDGERRGRGRHSRRRLHLPGRCLPPEHDRSPGATASTEAGTLVPGTNGGTIANTHRYADNGTYTITLTLTDSAGTTVQDSAQVTVANVAPTATLKSGGAVNEGSAGSVSFVNPFDPSSADTAAGFRYSFDFNNDGTFEVVEQHLAHRHRPRRVTWPTAPAPARSTAGSPTRTAGFTDYTTTIRCRTSRRRSAPAAVSTIAPGTTVSRIGSFADPGADTWSATVDYGDGSGPHPLALNPDKTFALGHTYSSPGSFAVTVWVADKDGAVGTGSFSVYVLPTAGDRHVGEDRDGQARHREEGQEDHRARAPVQRRTQPGPGAEPGRLTTCSPARSRRAARRTTRTCRCRRPSTVRRRTPSP